MTSFAEAWWHHLPRRLARPAPVLSALWRDGAHWSATPLAAALPLLGVVAGAVALIAPAEAPASAPVLTSTVAAAAVLAAGCLSSQSGLLAFLVAGLGGALRADSVREALVGATLLFLLAVLVPTAARNVSAALPGGPVVRVLASAAIGCWLVHAWAQAVPLARSVALHGSSAGELPEAALRGAVLLTVAAAALVLRSTLDERAAALRTAVLEDEQEAVEHRLSAGARALLGAALLLLPWAPLLREVPVLLAACVLLAVGLRLVRAGHAPALTPRRLHRTLEAHAGFVWIGLAAVSFGLALVLGRSGMLAGPQGVAVSLCIGLGLAVLTEVPRSRVGEEVPA